MLPSVVGGASRVPEIRDVPLLPRHRVEELTCVGVVRMREQLLGRTVLDDLAELHHRHAVAHLCGHAKIVRDEQHSEMELLANVGEELEHLRLHRHVEGGHRLVGNQHLGVECERPGDTDTLALPAGELVGVTIGGAGIEADEA